MSQDSFQINDDTIQKLMEEHKQLTSMFIHELRNPLSLIKGTLQYIEMKNPDVKEYKYWNQLAELIHDMEILMLDASLLNTSNILNIRSINLLDLIHHMVDNYMPQADNQQKTLTIRCSPECETLLYSYPCDPDKIKQVLSNLIKNALEATSAGDFIEVIIGFNSDYTASMLSIQINNNGPLIPEDELDTIFTPFVTHKLGGTGIGLALAKRIVEAHMGRIEVSSTKKLTGFSVLLPLP